MSPILHYTKKALLIGILGLLSACLKEIPRDTGNDEQRKKLAEIFAIDLQIKIPNTLTEVLKFDSTGYLDGLKLVDIHNYVQKPTDVEYIYSFSREFSFGTLDSDIKIKAYAQCLTGKIDPLIGDVIDPLIPDDIIISGPIIVIQKKSINVHPNDKLEVHFKVPNDKITPLGCTVYATTARNIVNAAVKFDLPAMLVKKYIP